MSLSEGRRGRVRRRPVTVVVVEGNKTQRALLCRVLQADGDIEVVGMAATADEAVALVKATAPKVVTVDLQIEGGGINAISELVRARAIPVLVLSVAVQGAWATRAVDALAAGAADVLPKPIRWDDAAQRNLRDEIRRLAGVRVRPATATALVDRAPTPPVPEPSSAPNRVVAIAASTGGPVAVANVLSKLEGLTAPVLVVQHLHPDFVTGFVSWIGRVSALPVKAARNGERLKGGCVYIAPGGVHLRVGVSATAVLDPSPEDAIHRPSADELFHSVAANVGARAVGVLLTGMGSDGAAGLLAIQAAGGTTIAQDEATSAVYGMPRAAAKLGAADRVLPLDRVGEAVVAACGRPRRGAKTES